MFEVAGSLFVINQVVDSRIRATDGARVAVLYRNRAELHRLGIEGEQTIRQQFAYTCKVLQRLSCLDGAQHTSDGS